MPALTLDTELAHPPARVWRALTDRRLLAEWFMSTDLEPDRSRRFRLFPGPDWGLPGPLEGELVDLSPPHRMVVLLRGEAVHARLTFELLPRPGDRCRLRLVHTAPLGLTGSLWRRNLARAYRERL
ncbi:MAG TPA: SRPBCC domain-containing protein, partial [Pilimelia sp.]|nr:SRPBCC domain-containing protein [Pilimelia sp.]